jgi:tetratricopeptide (TPR) repeat protein
MKYCFSVILCCATILINAQSNNLNNLQTELAYEQKIFKNINNLDSLNILFFKKAIYLKEQKKYGKAIQTLNRINENDLSDSSKFRLYYEQAILNYLTNNYNEVELNLNKTKYFISDTTFHNKLTLLEILNLNNLQRWGESKVLLISELKNKSDSNIINEWYKQALSLKLKKVKTAQTLQTFLPGTGHVYVGKTTHGIINAGLILSGLTWGAYNFYHGYYVTGVFTGFFISYVFYSGGIAYAINNVGKYNTMKINKINNDLNKKIIEILEP